MHDLFAMFLDADNDWIHLASGIGLLVVGGCGTVFWYFYRRDLSRSDETAKGIKESLDEHDDTLNDHETRITVIERTGDK